MESASAAATSTGVKNQAKTKPSLYKPLDFYLARAPLLPVQVYGELGAEQRRIALASDPLVRRALAAGSASLLDAIERHKRGSLTKRDADRMRAKLLRYEIRMATRPTPFGLFAGVAMGGWGSHTDFSIRSTCARTKTRPDMAWLMALVHSAEAIPAVRRRLRLVANPLALLEGGRMVLTERTPGGGATQAMPVSVRATGVVKQALQLAKTPIAYDDLSARILETNQNATREKVDKLLTELWEQTFLLTDLRPPLTTDDPARYVADRLAGIPEAEDLAKRLVGLLEASAAWDRLEDADGVERFEAQLKQTGIVTESSQQAPVQVDMAMSVGGRIHQMVGEEAARAAEILLRLSPFPYGSGAIAAYRQAYVGRYGHDREVPLLELLDPNRGLGPMSQHAFGPVGPDPTRAARRSRTLMQLACAALRDHQRTVILDEETLGKLETWTPAANAVPVSLDLNFSLGARSAGAIDEGDFTLVVGPNLGALAAGRNLGRFSQMLSPEGPACLASAAAQEEALAADHLWAEFVYLPVSLRMANVVIRPAVRSHEVVLGASAGVPASGVIPPDELVAGVKEGRFYVRWPAAGKRVMFTSGHMLSYHNAPAIGRFLMDLSSDGRALFSTFDWGPAEGFPYLPRVQSGRIVLRPAQWRIQQDDLDLKSAEAFRRSLKKWRAAWDAPRHICLTVGDNRLVLDLEDEDQAREIYAELQPLKEGDFIIVQEVLPGLDEAWMPGPGGNYYSELIASMVLRGGIQAGKADKKAGTQPTASMATEVAQVDPGLRRKPPGSEWLFVKLYCPRRLENDVISDAMFGFAEKAVASGLADSWFFIRYSDPEPHIRLRFHGTPERLTAHLFPHVCEWAGRLMSGGHCSKFVFDTYEPEVERFGGPLGLRVAEEIFYADSRSVADLIRCASKKLWPQDQTSLLAISVDDLLRGLGMDEADRLRWYRKQATEGGPEIGADYRARKLVLRSLLGRSDAYLAETAGGAEIASALAGRRQRLAPIAGLLRELEQEGKLTGSRDELCASFVHLHLNRMAGLEGAAEQRILSLLLRARDSLQKAPLLAADGG
jgi:thiopeptide-type bacteriocin biosynthesis protein